MSKRISFILLALSVFLTTNYVLGESASLSVKLAKLNDLEDHCLKVSDPPVSVGKSCLDRLSDYFENKPIWINATMIFHRNNKIKINHWVLNRRVPYLMFTDVDLIGDAPTWGDIFDGKVSERMAAVADVLDIEACAQLKDHGGIHPLLTSKCQARELYKYATYLDVCLSGFSRSSLLNANNPTTGVSVYETARKGLDNSQTIDEANDNDWKLVENYLHSMWITDQCSNMLVLPLDDNVDFVDTISGKGSFGDMEKALSTVHDTALAISARAGDPWAVASFYERGLSEDVEYWESLYEVNPLLFHRWMSTSIGNFWFDDEEQVLHAMKAYDIEKQQVPQAVELNLEQYLKKHHLDNLVNSLERMEPIREEDLDSSLKFPWNSEQDPLKLLRR